MRRAARGAARGAALVALASAFALGARAQASPPPARDGDEACLAGLVSAGHVQVEFYDRHGTRDWGGDTDFHFDQRNHYSYGWRWAIAGESLRVWVDVTAAIEITPRHVVHLPRGLNDSTGWYDRLRRHEYDHVAISTDQRPVLLAQYLVAHLPRLTRAFPAGTARTNALPERAIADAIEARYLAVVRLVQASYDRLDSLTQHGVRPVPDREAFFASLYDRDGLACSRFPFLAEAAPVLDAPRYRNAPRPRCDAEVRP